MSAYYADDWLTVYQGDARTVLSTLPDESVHCVVTSPPYWGLRDYGTATWDGGDAACVHSVGGQVNQTKDIGTLRATAIAAGQRPGVDASCRKCGATRVDSQIGLEPTPDAYVAALVGLFRELRRVLRPDGAVTEERNLRSVWTVATQPYPGAHFATFPRKLVEPCIKAGCPPDGTVLDPFAGSGTTGMVAQSLSRRAILIDLNADYLIQAMGRNRDIPLGLVG